MKSLVYTSLATFALAFSMPAQAASESSLQSPLFSLENNNFSSLSSITQDTAEQSRRGGFRGRGFRGRGFRGRGFRSGFGGFGGFRGTFIRPFIGFRLPTYWINPVFSVHNFNQYNLRAPTQGLVWSRYYNNAVLRDSQGFVHANVNNVQWNDGQSFQTSGNDFMPVEGQAYGWSEGTNVGGTPGGQTGTYQGQWTGQYIDPEKRQFQGEWNGTYTDENGEVFEGTYKGTAIGAPVVTPVSNQQVISQGQVIAPGQVITPGQNVPNLPAGAPFPGQPNGQIGNQQFGGNYEQCLRSNGVTGAALGALLGGIAGNRIAGRNARTAGTLIGGGVGALGGLAVERAADKCKNFKGGQTVAGQQFPQGQFPQQQIDNSEYERCLRKRGITGTVLGALLGGVAGNRIAGRNARTAGTLIGGGLGALTGRQIEKAARKCEKKRRFRNNGFTQTFQPVQYYYYSPGYYYPPPTTTTVTITPATTVTEEVTYETVRVKPKKRVWKKRKRLLKPKPKCNCNH